MMGVAFFLMPLLWAERAYAYIDPGTGSMILQAVIGGVGAGLVVIRLWWDNIKATFAQLIGRAPAGDIASKEKDARFDDNRHG
jgi:hypothetical protein